MNEVFLSGKAGGDAEVRQTQNGKAYVNFSLATSEKIPNSDEYKTDWHRVTVWGRQAKNIRKGDDVFVKGKYVENNYTDKEGREVRAHQVNAFFCMVGTAKPKPQTQAPPQRGFEEDDIPW